MTEPSDTDSEISPAAPQMVSARFGDTLFTLRAAAVCLAHGRVLIGSAPGLNYWYLPGGRVHIGETAAETMARELYEELGVRVEPGRLLWIVENHYVDGGIGVHEVGFYLEADLPADSESAGWHGQMERLESADGLVLSWRWQPLDRLEDIDLRPRAIAEALRAIPAAPCHLVVRESR